MVPPIDFISPILPIGVSSLATILRNKHNVTFVRYKALLEQGVLNEGFNQRNDLIRLAKFIESLNPDIVGFSSVATDFHVHIYVARELKSISDTKIVFGGPAPSAVAYEVINKFNWVDAVAIGESENNILQLVDCLLNEKDYENVPGVVFQSQKSSHKTYQFVSDLSSLDLVYNGEDVCIGGLGGKPFPIETGRGCPFRCTFCFSSTLPENKYRRKTNERILFEIENYYTKYGIVRYIFTHDLFAYDKRLLFEFCLMLNERNIKIDWAATSRIDTIDKELLQVMIDSGCMSLFFGIESGSERIQGLINKNINIDTIYENIDVMLSVGLKHPQFAFIYGFPQEDDSDLEQTMDVISYLLQRGYQLIELRKLTLFNSSKLYESLKNSLKYYMPITTSSSISYYMDCTKDIYMENMTIFPHMFELDTQIINKYSLLELFVNCAVCQFAKYHKLSSRLLFTCGAEILCAYHHFADYQKKYSLNMLNVSIDELEELFLFLANKICQKDMLDVFVAIFSYEKGVRLIRFNKLDTFSFRTRLDLSKMSKFMSPPYLVTNHLLTKDTIATLSRSGNGISVSYST